jgi:hypothetical protein
MELKIKSQIEMFKVLSILYGEKRRAYCTLSIECNKNMHATFYFLYTIFSVSSSFQKEHGAL